MVLCDSDLGMWNHVLVLFLTIGYYILQTKKNKLKILNNTSIVFFIVYFLSDYISISSFVQQYGCKD